MSQRFTTLAIVSVFSFFACESGPGSLGPDGSGEQTRSLSAANFVSTFVVTNTGDTGAGSLRQALLDANASPGHDLIAFAIPGAGPHTIQPESELPFITDPVTIDGYTQPGASPNTNGPRQGTNAVLKVVLNGDGGGGRLWVQAPNTVIRGLVINGATGAVPLHGDGAVLAGCFIGTDATGTIRIGVRGRAVNTNAINVVIGGPNPADRNLISGVNGEAVFMHGTGNRLQNNIIGLDASGTTVLGNEAGVFVLGPGNVVGGGAFDVGNVISGVTAGQSEAMVIRGDDTEVTGNLIGTDVSGTIALPHTLRGIRLLGRDVRVGDVDKGNLVVVGKGPAIDTSNSGTANTRIEENLFGVDITGEDILGSDADIILQVGGSEPSLIRGNTIAGDGAPMVLGSPGGHQVLGNKVGTNSAGTKVLGMEFGINVASSGNRIGGTNPGDGNILTGILIQGTGNVIQGNAIGTDFTGTLDLGSHQGITVGFNSPGNNLIGGPESRAGNLIAHGGSVGVACCSAGNTISRNSIHSTNNRGINHAPGGNKDQEFPTLATVTSGAGVVTIAGVLLSATSSAYTLEFFSNPVPDPSGFGEGETFIGALDVTTDATGQADFLAVFQVPVPVGHYATATATGPDGSTSEFSAAVEFVSASPQQTIQDLIDLVQELVARGQLQQGPASGMIHLLEQAKRQAEAGNDDTAVRQLEAFIRLVEQSVATGKLNAADGDTLVLLAEVAIQRLGG